MASQRYEVLLSPECLKDLEAIHSALSSQMGQEHADATITDIEAAIVSLEKTPTQGTPPQELQGTGIDRYRETYAKPWRILYEVRKNTVYVHWIFDARKSVTRQLCERMLC